MTNLREIELRLGEGAAFAIFFATAEGRGQPPSPRLRCAKEGRRGRRGEPLRLLPQSFASRQAWRVGVTVVKSWVRKMTVSITKSNERRCKSECSYRS